MKYRIVEKDLGDEIRFYIQWRFLWIFWLEIVDSIDTNVNYSSYDKCKEWIEKDIETRLKHKNKAKTKIHNL